MSQKDKKSKSKSKEKSDKPAKQGKQKKSKEGDSKSKQDKKSKKSVQKPQKAQKGQKVSKKKKQQKSQKPSKELDMSQDNFSDFMKNPYSFPPAFTSDDALCAHHKEPTTLFCEICEQTGCESCIIYGPHNNQMHRITKIDEAFQARYLYLNQLVCGSLLQKRQKLNKYLQQLTVLSDQLRYHKNGIQKITKNQFNQMLERLKHSAGSKFAILHHEMADLQRDLQAINALGNQFFQLTNLNPITPSSGQPTPKAIVPFLLRSRYLQEQAQNLIAKPIKTSVQIYPYDLPRQLTERKLILDKNKGWIDLLKTKDEAVWSLTQEKKNLRNKLWDSLNQQAKTQIMQWQKLKAKIQDQLQELSLNCRKCGCNVHEDTVNDACSKGQYHLFSPS